MKRLVQALIAGIVVGIALGLVMDFLVEQYVLLHNIANFLSQLTQRGS